MTCLPETDPGRIRRIVEKKAKESQMEGDTHQNISSSNCVKPRCCKARE